MNGNALQDDGRGKRAEGANGRINPATGLTDKEAIFVSACAAGKSQREAFKLAYRAQWPDHALDTGAHKVAARPRVRAALDKALRAARGEDDKGRDVLRYDAARVRAYVMGRLWEIASGDGGPAVKACELLGRVAGVDLFETGDKPVDTPVDVRKALAAKVKALFEAQGIKVLQGDSRELTLPRQGSEAVPVSITREKGDDGG